MITLGGKHYLEESDLAKILNRTVQTVRVWRYARTGPPYTKIGSVTLYPEEEVQKWLDAKAQSSPASPVSPASKRIAGYR